MSDTFVVHAFGQNATTSSAITSWNDISDSTTGQQLFNIRNDNNTGGPLSTGNWTTAQTSGTVFNTPTEDYVFDIETKGDYLIATDKQHRLRVMAKSRRILEEKCRRIVAVKQGFISDESLLTLWGTHNERAYSRRV